VGETREKGLLTPLTDIIAYGMKRAVVLFIFFLVLYLVMRMFFATRYRALVYKLKGVSLKEKLSVNGE